MAADAFRRTSFGTDGKLVCESDRVLFHERQLQGE